MYHFTLLVEGAAVPSLGFCLRRGFANCALRDGAESPMRANSSRVMPSGFFASFDLVEAEPAAALPLDAAGKERIERTSAAEAAIC